MSAEYRQGSVGRPAVEQVLITRRHTENRQIQQMKHTHKATRRVAYAVVPALCATGVAVADIQETELPPVTVSAHGGLAIPYDKTGVSVEVVDIEQMKGHKPLQFSSTY